MVLVALTVLAVPSALAATQPVDITRAGFTPNKVTIDFGDTVTWTNKDTQDHQVLADQAAFPTSPVLTPNQAYSYTFTKSGSFGYRDALNTNRRGTVTVRPGISIKAASAVVSYGKTTTLSGSVSNGASGESVTVDAKQCGATTFSRLAGLQSATGGGWSTPAKPVANTVFRANWKNSKSPELTVSVAPLVALKRVRAGRFTAKVSAAVGLNGKHVIVQRYVRSKHAWKNVKRVVLTKTQPSTAPTLLSSASFRLRIARGTRLRLLLPQDQATGVCYVAAHSSAVRA